MTIRSILLGFLGVIGVCGFTFINDRILKQTFLIGNNLPVCVYGSLIIIAVAINPLLRRLRLRPGELSVALLITLAACCIPGSGLMRTFCSSLLLPNHYAKTNAAWREQRIIEYVPPQMMPELTEENEDLVLGGYIQGLSVGADHASPLSVPWKAWRRPVLFWAPLLFFLWFSMLSLSLVLHRQWATHEHIPYPVSRFVDTLITENPHENVLRNRLFWIGTLFVLFIHLNNYLCVWFPDYLIPIKRRLELWPFASKFPMLVRGGTGELFGPQLYFSFIGIAFLIPSDVSFSFALGPWLWSLITGCLISYGIDLNQVLEGSYWYTGLRPRMFVLFGSNVGLFLAMLYTGRHYYANVFKAAFGRKAKDVEPLSVWGCRLFLVFLLAFTIQLIRIGIDWQLAIMYSAVLVIFYVVMTRTICESGLFHLQLNIFPCCIIWGFLGVVNLGPRTLLIMQLVSLILLCDPRESLMPFVMNSLKLLDEHRSPLGKASFCAALALIVGLAVALPVSLYVHYDQGSAIWEGWADNDVPKMMFENAISVQQKLTVQGTLEQANAVSGWGRFAHIHPNAICMWCFVIGFAMVLMFSAARLRFSWWPLHPLLFITWNTPHMHMVAGSFFIGWAIKACIIHFGGNSVYRKVAPLMIGGICGEILGALVPSITAAIYYAITHEIPKAFFVMLG